MSRADDVLGFAIGARRIALLVLALPLTACGTASAPPARGDAARPEAPIAHVTPDAAPASLDAAAPPSQTLSIVAMHTHGETGLDSGSETERYHLAGDTLTWSVEADRGYSGHVKEGHGDQTLSADQLAALTKLVTTSGVLAPPPATVVSSTDSHSFDTTELTIELAGERHAIEINGAQSGDPRDPPVRALLGALAALGHP